MPASPTEGGAAVPSAETEDEERSVAHCGGGGAGWWDPPRTHEEKAKYDDDEGRTMDEDSACYDDVGDSDRRRRRRGARGLLGRRGRHHSSDDDDGILTCDGHGRDALVAALVVSNVLCSGLIVASRGAAGLPLAAVATIAASALLGCLYLPHQRDDSSFGVAIFGLVTLVAVQLCFLTSPARVTDLLVGWVLAAGVLLVAVLLCQGTIRCTTWTRRRWCPVGDHDDDGSRASRYYRGPEL